jgi:hypothetical protein
MQALLGIAIVGSFPSVAILWTWAMVGALRLFQVPLPFSFPFHFYTRRERELHTALKGKPMGTHVFVSGILLFSCPWWAGMTTFDLLTNRYVGPSTFSVNRFTGTALLWAVAGVWFGVSDWKKSQREGIGTAS